MKLFKKSVFGIGLLIIFAFVLSSCSGGNSPGGAATSTTGSLIKPIKSFSAPKSIDGAASVMSDDTQWLLAGGSSERTLQQINLKTGTLGAPVPESTSAVAIAETVNRVLLVGLNTGNGGAVEIHNGNSGALSYTIPVSDPVQSLSVSADGSIVYVLENNGSAVSLQKIALDTYHIVGTTIPLVSDAISVVVSTSGADLFVLEANGKIDEIPASGVGQISTFAVGSGAHSLIISPDSQTLFVLKCPAGSCNVSVVNVAGQQVVKVLPAPLNTVQISLSASGDSLWDAVGSSAYGNVQEFSLS